MSARSSPHAPTRRAAPASPRGADLRGGLGRSPGGLEETPRPQDDGARLGLPWAYAVEVTEEEPLPAWSLPADAVERIALPEAWPGRITRDWAWGGATGAGVRVCVLDSGVEAGHAMVGDVQQSVAIAIEGDEVLVDERDTAGDLCGHG